MQRLPKDPLSELHAVRRIRPNVDITLRMSALGQKQTFQLASDMSALPPKADITQRAKVALIRHGDY